MRKSFLLLLISIFILLIPQFASAEKSEWINENYDFSKIKKVLIVCLVPDETRRYVSDPYIGLNYPKVLIDKLKEKNQNLIVHTLADANKLLDQETDGKFSQLLRANNQEALIQLKAFTSDFYDATVFVKFFSYNYSSQYQEGYSYNVTSTSTSTVHHAGGGLSTINTPTTTTYNVPGGNVSVANVHIDFSVIDSKTNDFIYGRNEYRSNDAQGIWKTSPEAVSKRIGGSFVDKLTDLIKDGAKIK